MCFPKWNELKILKKKPAFGRSVNPPLLPRPQKEGGGFLVRGGLFTNIPTDVVVTDFFGHPDCTLSVGPSKKLMTFDVPKSCVFFQSAKPSRFTAFLVRAIRFSASHTMIPYLGSRVSEWKPDLKVGDYLNSEYLESLLFSALIHQVPCLIDDSECVTLSHQWKLLNFTARSRDHLSRSLSNLYDCFKSVITSERMSQSI